MEETRSALLNQAFPPVLMATGKSIPEAWEHSMMGLLSRGELTKSQHEPKGNPGTLDSTMTIVIEDPLAEPRIHRCMPGGLEDLATYVDEVVDGIHDDRVNSFQGGWQYTYHQRFTGHRAHCGCYSPIDQLGAAIAALAEAPHTRRAQAITWDPSRDIGSKDPPCLQRLWFRVHEIDGEKYLLMNSHWRSRDALKAAFMNLYALSELQKRIAAKVSEVRGEEIVPGRIVDISDSYHLYLGYKDEIDQFRRSLVERTFEERTYTTEFARPIFEEARARRQI